MEIKTVKSIQLDGGKAAAFQEFFDEWMKDNDIVVTYRDRVTIRGVSWTTEYLENKLFVEAQAHPKRFGYKLCMSALSLWRENNRKIQRQEMIDKIISYEPNEELDKFCASFIEGNQALAKAAFQHFMWQVKRKMLGIPVFDHLMIVVTGRQNSGKTTAISKLLAPIADLCVEKHIDEVCDKKQAKMFQDHYVIFCDEMSKAEHAEIEVLKNHITANEISTRRYFTQEQAYCKNNCTFIGCANPPLETIVRDATGMRRFLELVSLPMTDRDLLNSLDFEKIWHNADINHSGYIIPHRQKIEAMQEGYRDFSEVEEFCQEISLEKSEDTKIELAEIYAVYKKYMEDTGSAKLSAKGLTTALIKLGYKNRVEGRRVLSSRGKTALLCNSELFRDRQLVTAYEPR